MTPETDENGNAPAAPAARGRKDNLWAGLATTVAVASMFWIAYQSTVRNEYHYSKGELKPQHAELQYLKGKIQEMAATQSQTDVEPSKSEIQGLQNHVNILRGSKNSEKNRLVDHSPSDREPPRLGS